MVLSNSIQQLTPFSLLVTDRKYTHAATHTDVSV